MDTSTEKLEKTNETLQKNVLLMQEKLDTKNQELHEAKLQLNLANSLNREYIQEIEMLQCKKSEKVFSLQKKLRESEERLSLNREKHNQKLQDKLEIIEKFKNDIRVAKNSSEEAKKSKKLDEVDVTKIAICKAEYQELKEQLKELEININCVKTHNGVLEESRHKLISEVEELNEKCASKTHELTAANGLLQNQQEELYLTQVEVESLKNIPLDADKKGNSLFAEVDDCRLKIIDSIDKVRKNYGDMKRNMLKILKEIMTVNKENMELSSKLDSTINYHERYEKVLTEYRIKICSLEDLLVKYEEEILIEHKYKGKDLPSFVEDLANITLHSNWKDEVNARRIITEESRNNIEIFQNIQMANTELRKWRRQAQQLKINVDNLEKRVLEKELQTSPTLLEDFDDLIKESLEIVTELENDESKLNHDSDSYETEEHTCSITMRKKSASSKYDKDSKLLNSVKIQSHVSQEMLAKKSNLGGVPFNSEESTETNSTEMEHFNTSQDPNVLGLKPITEASDKPQLTDNIDLFTELQLASTFKCESQNDENVEKCLNDTQDLKTIENPNFSTSTAAILCEKKVVKSKCSYIPVLQHQK